MSRVMNTTQPVLLASGVFVTMFTVPAGHKYELVGSAITAGTASAPNVAGLHTFASTAAVLNAFAGTTPAVANTVFFDHHSEVFLAGDKFALVWASGTGSGQAFCWYVDVHPV